MTDAGAGRTEVRPSASRAQRGEAGRAARERVSLDAHAHVPAAGDRPDPLAALGAQDATRITELVPIRYGRMVETPFTFLRGAAAVMAGDLATVPSTGLQVQLCGDAHLANFGAFSAPDRRLVVDVNDFDETLPGPFEWDVKRLVASLVVAARNNGFDRSRTSRIGLETIEAYRSAIEAAAAMDPLDVWYARVELENLVDLDRGPDRKRLEASIQEATAKASRKDRVRAWRKLTEEVDGRRRIAPNPPLTVRPTPAELRAELEQLYDFLERCRESLSPDRLAVLDRYRVTDIAHRVVGVGSVGTRCWLLLAESGDGEPLFLQFKEATQSVLEPHAGASEFPNSGQRVVRGQELMQAASDVFLGWARYTAAEGDQRDFYFRQFWDGKWSPTIETLRPKQLRRVGRFCGLVLARAHARSGDAAMISGYLGDDDTFDRAIVEFAEAYADVTESDHARLVAAIDTGEIEAQRGL